MSQFLKKWHELTRMKLLQQQGSRPQQLHVEDVEHNIHPVQELDDKGASRLQQELLDSKQAGYAPETDEEKKAHRNLNRKLDLYVLPFCVLIYLFNGLDRSNLGNAQTDGFTDDLGMPATAINTATSLFFCTFVPLQPISVAFGKKIGQSYYLGIIAIGWGALTLGHAFIKTERQLIAVRLLIGVFEAGFYPTCVSYLASFYPRFDLAFRIALLYGSYAIAGAFGGLIAYGCFHIGGSLHGWQYLFIIEGSITLVIALLMPFWLPPNAGSAWFLTESERAFAERRMAIDAAANFNSRTKLSKRDIIEAIKDWKLWGVLPFNVLASTAPQGFTIFLPIVIKGLGYSGATANLLTIPPYVIGTILLLLFAHSSDHFRERTLHILTGLLIVLLGLILAIVLPLSNIGGSYAGIFVLLAGISPFDKSFFLKLTSPARNIHRRPLTVAWLSGDTPEPGKRTIVLGINGWCNLGGIIGSELFRAQYGPDYHFPLKVTAGLIAVAWVGYAAYHFELRAANRWKARKVRGWGAEEVAEEEGEGRWGDRKWTFVYGL